MVSAAPAATPAIPAPASAPQAQQALRGASVSEIDPRQSASLSYTFVLAELADEYDVFYSLPTLDGDGEHPARDGEADFVIVQPAGILVIEVKGGGVSFDPKTGDWHSRNASGKQHRIKDPFKQASDRKFDYVYFLSGFASALGPPRQRVLHTELHVSPVAPGPTLKEVR